MRKPYTAKMGLFDMLANILKIKKEQINILVVGLNNSGKSTIVNHFKDPEERSPVTLPTVGFNVEKFQSEFRIRIGTTQSDQCILRYQIYRQSF